MKKFTRMLNGNWNWWSPRYKVYFGWHQITIERAVMQSPIFLEMFEFFVVTSASCPLCAELTVIGSMWSCIKLSKFIRAGLALQPRHEKDAWEIANSFGNGGSEQSEKYITGVYYVIKVRAAGRKQTSNNLNMCECPAAKRTQEWRNKLLNLEN